MSATKKRRWGIMAATGLLMAVLPATSALAANPSLDNFTPPDDSIAKTAKFEGCIQDGTFTLPTGFGGSVGDKFACPDDSGNDSDYTPGSLSGWNELDFVPFFLRGRVRQSV